MYNDSMDESQLQLNEKDELCHLLTLKNLDKTAIEKMLDQAQKYISSKIMSYYRPADLDGIRCGYVRSS